MCLDYWISFQVVWGKGSVDPIPTFPYKPIMNVLSCFTRICLRNHILNIDSDIDLNHLTPSNRVLSFVSNISINSSKTLIRP